MKRFFKKTDGFTLIELLVVIVIIALLMAIAIPAYLSQQKKAKDSAAKQYLNVAWKAARAAAVDTSGNYYQSATSLEAAVTASEPYLSVRLRNKATMAAAAGCTAVTGPKTIVVGREQNTTSIFLFSKSDSGRIWAIAAASGVNGLSNTGTPNYYNVKSC